MTIILDLDDTLVETAGYKRVLFRSLEVHGVPLTVVADSYRRLRHQHENSIEGLYAFLPKKFRPPYAVYVRAIARTLRDYYPLHLYSDVRWFLRRCRGHRRILYTYGETKVQRMKIQSLRIRPLFHEIAITEDRNKVQALKPLLRAGELTVLIDNDSKFIEAAHAHFSTLRVFRIQRGHLSHVGKYYPDLRTIYQALRKEHLL